MKEKTEKKDKFRRVKFMGYCMSQLPPDGFGLDFEDYMNWILFQLCKHYKIPTKSDVWDKYTDEELLVEYYAIRFDTDDDEMKKFEGIIEGLAGGDDDIYDWFDKQIEQNKKEVKEKEAEMEDDLSFSPDTMG